MNFLLVGANPNNSTDGVIVRGIHTLLEFTFDQYTYEYVTIRDHQPQKAADFHPDKQFDAIIVCGTPWLWDSFQLSVKYKNLLECIENTHFDSKIIFMGIGSCLNIKDMESDLLERKEERNAMNNLYDNIGTTVITRDSLANEKLNKANIFNTLLLCPAYFCYGVVPASSAYNKEDNIMIWQDPTQSISGEDWKSKQKLDKFKQLFLDFYIKYAPDVYCAQDADVQMALDIGLPHPTVLRHWSDTLGIMQDAKRVLSARVHCAVPAIVQGAITELIALDSRSLVVQDVNFKLNLEYEALKYKNILKAAFY